MHRLNHQWLAPLEPGKCFFGRFLLRLSRLKRPQVMSMVKFSSTALNLVMILFYKYIYFGTPCTITLKSVICILKQTGEKGRSQAYIGHILGIYWACFRYILVILLRQTGEKGRSQARSPRQVTRLGPTRENPGTQLNLFRVVVVSTFKQNSNVGY